MTSQHRKAKILVGMSGGVDSSVAALLLKKQGYEVIGAFIKNWSDEVGRKQLCWVDDRRDAMRVAAKINIPFITFDFEPEFHRYVVDYLYNEYAAGRTPNPDIACNKWIKFPLLLREAKKLGAEFVATGHYCRLRQKSEILNSKFETNSKFKIQNSKHGTIYELYKAVDKNKDQSYFLYTLDQEILRHCLFPLGELTKKEVRQIALKAKLPTAKKPDSQGICFIGELKMNEFLHKRLPDKPGQIKTIDGQTIGKHRGLHYYTIGQRQGIGIGGRKEGSEPLYVVRKDLKNNVLVVGLENSKELFSTFANLEQVHWILPPPTRLARRSDESERVLPPPKGEGGGGCRINVKIRYRAPDASAKLDFKNGQYTLYFDEPQRAVTPGQSAVFYDGEKMLGGGIIS